MVVKNEHKPATQEKDSPENAGEKTIVIRPASPFEEAVERVLRKNNLEYPLIGNDNPKPPNKS